MSTEDKKDDEGFGEEEKQDEEMETVGKLFVNYYMKQGRLCAII